MALSTTFYAICPGNYQIQ